MRRSCSYAFLVEMKEKAEVGEVCKGLEEWGCVVL